MKSFHTSVADLVVKTLEDIGVDTIFGIPGSYDGRMYHALRKSSIRFILPTNELNAAFMANGYYRNSGRAGVILAIAGPGFTNAITGLAEAHFDSAGVVCMICKPSDLPGSKFQLQKLDEKEIVRTITKGCVSVVDGNEVPIALRDCFTLALSGEPGPVLFEIPAGLLSEKVKGTSANNVPPEPQTPLINENRFDEIVGLIRSSRRAVLYLGLGVADASNQIANVSDLIKAPVLTTTSGRGIIPEQHPMSLPSDLVKNIKIVNEILASCDLILALGCKLTHNGTKGFKLKFPKEKLIHVDASTEVLEANYPARATITSDATQFLNFLLERRSMFEPRRAEWKNGEIDHWRQSLRQDRNKKSIPEPNFEGIKNRSARTFFSLLHDNLPEHSCVITDSGWHQMLARKYLEIRTPRGLITPADYQSMGFGIPAGIGAKLSDPARHVIVIAGDGGFALSGMELSTAVREKLNITVILFNDNSLGLIRLYQLSHLGHSHAVQTSQIDYEAFCRALGITYYRVNGNFQEILQRSLDGHGVSLIEVVLKDSLDLQKAVSKGLARNILKI